MNSIKNLKHIYFSRSLKTCSDFYQSKNFRTFSHHNSKIFKKNSKFVNYLKAQKFNSIETKEFFDSFHKSLMHRKLSSNPKYLEIEKAICYTDREGKAKELIEEGNETNCPFKNRFEKLFLTNYNDSYNNKKNLKRINRPLKELKIYNYTEIENKYNNNNNKIKYQSNIFLPLDLKRFRNNDCLNVFHPKISDFIEDIRMLRTSKFINTLKNDQYQKTNALVKFDKGAYDITIYSLNNSIQLLNSYNSSFTQYNKYLEDEILLEKNILKSYISEESKVKEQVLILQKKLDDLIIELEILNNFKNLFDAIKKKTLIIKNNDLSHKSFAQKIKENLRNQVLLNKNNIMNKKIQRKKTSTKYLHFHKKSKDIKETEKEKNNKNYRIWKTIDIRERENNEKFGKGIKNLFRNSRKYQTSLNSKSHNKDKKKIARFNSIQPSMFAFKNIDNENRREARLKQVILHNNDIRNELTKIKNNIIQFIEKYNDIQSYVVNSKLLFENEINSIDNIILRKEIKEKVNELNYCKNYESILISKLNLIKFQYNDYSLFFIIYRKLNGVIYLIIDYKIKNFQILIDKLSDIYDKNKIYFYYKKEKKENSSKRAFLENELIQYVYKVLIIIEKLALELIEGKNNYLKNNYYSERIEEFENKIDNDKKLFNNKLNKNEELIRREKIRQKTKKKLNKMIYLPRRKVAENYHFVNIKKAKTQEIINIKENMLFY